MRRWLIIDALLVNGLLGGLVLLMLLGDGGWGEAARLSATEAKLLTVVAAAAVVLDLLLAPVLGLSFWSRDRGTRQLETRLAASEAQPRHGPPGSGGADRPPVPGAAAPLRGAPAEGAGTLGQA